MGKMMLIQRETPLFCLNNWWLKTARFQLMLCEQLQLFFMRLVFFFIFFVFLLLLRAVCPLGHEIVYVLGRNMLK